MKSGYVYTVVFMFLISALFTIFLAGANAFYLPVIEKNSELAQKKSLLYVFGEAAATDAAERIFKESIKYKEISGTGAYIKYDKNNNIVGYAVPFSGSGLWGTIKGYMAVSADLKKVLGVDFTSHNETPGLGGRIDELWFKEQFRGLEIDMSKGFAYRSGSDGELDAVTGATITSKSVLNILNKLIEDTLSRLEVE